MRIQHNIAALNSHRQLTSNNSSVGKNLEKLSSGYRINRAGDDAAGLAISEKMRAQITSLNTASKNAQDGISLVQTAEGALTEVHSMLNRMTELAGQAANGTYQNEVDRENAMKELDSLRSEIDRISDSTNFNGIKLLNGTMGGGTTGVTGTQAIAGSSGVDFTVSGVGEGIKVAFSAVAKSAAPTGLTASWAGNQITFTFDAANGAKFTQEDIDNAIKNASDAPISGKGLKVSLKNDITFTADSTAVTGTAVTTASAKYADYKGAAVNNSAGASTKVTVTSTKAGATNGTFNVTNTAANAVEALKAANGNVTLNLSATDSYSASQINQLLSKAGSNMTVSFDGTLTGANVATSMGGAGTAQTLTGGAGVAAGGGLSLQIGESSDSFNQLTVAVKSMSTQSLGIDGISIETQDSAKDAVDFIKTAINTVSSTRGDLGAIQNRLEHTINNLGVTAENMTAAESRIRDVDMAQEMMNFTKNNILTQASQAMLAQANQLPQGVLQLLQ